MRVGLTFTRREWLLAREALNNGWLSSGEPRLAFKRIVLRELRRIVARAYEKRRADHKAHLYD
jgi:hypothetical protein